MWDKDDVCTHSKVSGDKGSDKSFSKLMVFTDAKQSVLQAMTKRFLFQCRSGASASFVHVVLRKFSGVEVKILMREAG
ncbi:hypothetical protein TNCV_2255791 [Trichonephila clavipes]|nr:hypothetical protein TNCV_2255791 [Trichonephila clavipes]